MGKESNNLIEYNGTVYNPNEFGNLVWGAGMAALGVTLNPVTLAEIGTKKTRGLMASDEPHDRNAIIKGVEIGTSVRAAVFGNKKAITEKNTIEVMNGANKCYKSGQSNKSYSHEKKIQNEKN